MTMMIKITSNTTSSTIQTIIPAMAPARTHAKLCQHQSNGVADNDSHTDNEEYM